MQATPDFTEQPQALNGPSHLINEVFGAKGRHSRMIYTDPGMCLDWHDVGGVVGGGGEVTPEIWGVRRRECRHGTAGAGVLRRVRAARARMRPLPSRNRFSLRIENGISPHDRRPPPTLFGASWWRNQYSSRIS